MDVLKNQVYVIKRRDHNPEIVKIRGTENGFVSFITYNDTENEVKLHISDFLFSVLAYITTIEDEKIKKGQAVKVYTTDQIIDLIVGSSKKKTIKGFLYSRATRNTSPIALYNKNIPKEFCKVDMTVGIKPGLKVRVNTISFKDELKKKKKFEEEFPRS